jgi:DNA polymerase
VSVSSFSTEPIAVGAEGPRTALIVGVGEALGTQEARLRRPFVGPAGQFLDECLKSAGIIRRDIYLTNVIKEQPYRNEIERFIDLSKKTPVITPEAQAYIEILREELSALPCNIIVAFGNTPLFALTGQTGVTKRRGSVYPCTLVPGKKVLACIHPSAALRQYLFKYPIIRDLKRAVLESGFPEIRNDDHNIRLEPSFFESAEFLHRILENETSTALDIEVFNEEMSCISLGNPSIGYLCIPFIGTEGDYFSAEQESELMSLLCAICAHPLIRKIGQNLVFDATFLFCKYGIQMR